MIFKTEPESVRLSNEPVRIGGPASPAQKWTGQGREEPI